MSPGVDTAGPVIAGLRKGGRCKVVVGEFCRGEGNNAAGVR